MAWPPTLAELKDEMKIELTDTRDDARLTRNLDAAVSFVERVRRGSFRFDPLNADQISLPEPNADTILGTLRLAARWKWRDRSPDGVIDMGELGSSRVSTFDPDIDRLLRLGKHQRARVG